MKKQRVCPRASTFSSVHHPAIRAFKNIIVNYQAPLSFPHSFTCGSRARRSHATIPLWSWAPHLFTKSIQNALYLKGNELDRYWRMSRTERAAFPFSYLSYLVSPKSGSAIPKWLPLLEKSSSREPDLTFKTWNFLLKGKEWTKWLWKQQLLALLRFTVLYWKTLCFTGKSRALLQPGSGASV